MIPKKCVFWVLSFCLLSVSINTHAMEQKEGSTGPKSEGQQEEQATEYKITNSPSTVTAAATFISTSEDTITIVLSKEDDTHIENIASSIQKIFSNPKNTTFGFVFEYTPEHEDYISTAIAQLSLSNLINFTSTETENQLDLNNNTSLTLKKSFVFKLKQSRTSHYIFIISAPQNVSLNLFTVIDAAREINLMHAKQINTNGMSWLKRKWYWARGYKPIASDSYIWAQPINWNAYFNGPSRLGTYAFAGAGLVGAAGLAYTAYHGPKQAYQNVAQAARWAKSALVDKGRKLLSGKK